MQKNSRKLSYHVSHEQAGIRLDKYLSMFEEVGSRTRASYLIEKGAVLVNAKATKASYLVNTSDFIEIEFQEVEVSTKIMPMQFNLDILYEDKDVIVINKPAGLVVHPAAGHAQDTLVNALVAHTEDLSMKFGENRPGIVHRLDKETSGILVVAKNDRAHELLSEQFKSRKIHRRYEAVVYGQLKNKKGSTQSWLARHSADRKKYASVRDRRGKILTDEALAVTNGKWAKTDFEVIGEYSRYLSFVRLKLHTGRTHQIRVHLSELGHPIVGDLMYGANKKLSSIKDQDLLEKLKQVPRFTLHAAELGFYHPTSKEHLLFQVPWPEDVRGFLQYLRFVED